MDKPAFEVFFIPENYSIFCKCMMPDRWAFHTARGHMNVFDTEEEAMAAAAKGRAVAI